MSDRFRDISHVVSVQILSRLATFGMNVGIARVVSPEDYGVGFVAFQLFLNLALFFPKECFRKVALRSDVGGCGGELGASCRRSSLNVSWFGVPIAVLGAILLGSYWASGPRQGLVLAILVVAAALEGLAEPFLVEVLLPPRSDFRARANGEASCIVVRTIFILIFVCGGGSLPTAFATGSLLYSVLWFSWFYRRSAFDTPILPSKLLDGSFLTAQHRDLITVFAGNTLLKLFLTEGEKILLLAVFAEKDWGVFGLVSNLGSIVLRLLFAPTEEIAYASFGQRQDHASAHWPLLRSLLLLQGSVGWIGLCFGPAFSSVVVRILYGAVWCASGAPIALAFYCVLLFLMALNGVLEAFVYATASPSWLWITQIWSVVASCALVGVAWLVRDHGPSGLVVANCVAMSIRILVCSIYVRRELGVGFKEIEAPKKFLALVAIGGCISGSIVPALGLSPEKVPWFAVARAVLLAVMSIAGASFASRRELLNLLSSVRGAKKDI